jgi:hypothetical protein
MPIPKRNKGEPRKKFLERCMSDDVMLREFKDDKQRYAVCLTKASEKCEKN